MMRIATSLAVLAMGLTGCVGTVDGGPVPYDPGGPGTGPGTGHPGTGGPGPGGVCVDSVGSAPLRRLSLTEHRRTLADLFPGLTVSLPAGPIDDVGEHTYDNDALALGPSDVRVSDWETTAFTIADAAVRDGATRADLFSCGAPTTAAEAHACASEFITRFGARALRHPLSADEQTSFEAYFESQRVAIDFDAAAVLTITAMLESPRFLYRMELDGAAGPDSVALSPHELASRLSYFLWQSMPDEQLFAAAATGALENATGVETEVRRMLDDARAGDTIVDFHQQWLALGRVARVDEPRVASLYPEWNEALRDSLVTESEALVRSALVDGDGTLSSLLLSRSAHVDEALARLYGVAPPSPGTWADVTLPEGERAGILTRGAFLASRAHATSGSPPLRGAYIMTRVLCEPSLTPPPTADLTPPTPMAGEGPVTNRTLFERRTETPACLGCHQRINGFGFGFEHYDAIGRFRSLDDGLPVDATGSLIGTDVDGDYDGAVALSEHLAESGEVRACASSQWTRFALGRSAEQADGCFAERLTQAFDATGGDVRELLVSIATAPEMRRRPLAE